MYPANTQLLAKWSSPSIGDQRATGWGVNRVKGTWGGGENTCGRKALYDGTSVRAPPETREPKRQKISTDL